MPRTRPRRTALRQGKETSTLSTAAVASPAHRSGESHSEGFCAPSHRPWILTAAVLASAMGFIDGSVVSIALPAMRDGLGASLTQALWINNAYLLPLSALILVGGALGDRYGVAKVFGAGIAVFVVASAVTAIAPNPELLIGSRAAKGIGAALMVPGSLAIIAKAYPKAERGKAIGIWAASSAVTTALGPVLGGAALTYIGDWAWRAIFALNVPLGAATLWMLWAKVGADKPSDEGAVDWLGGALATLALGLGAWALTGLQQEETAVPIWLLAAGSAATFAAFLLREARASHPMVPLKLFRSVPCAAANLATLLLYFALGAVLFYLPQVVIAGWGRSELEISLIFIPFSALMAVLGPVAGRMADRIGPGLPIAGGSALVAVSFAGLALTIGMQSFWGVVLPLITVMGLGMAFVVSPLSTAVMGAVRDEQTGTASGINNAVSRMANLIAVAAMGAVAALIYQANASGGSFGETGADGAAMNAGFAAVAWITAALSAAAAAVAFFGIPKEGSSD